MDLNRRRFLQSSAATLAAGVAVTQGLIAPSTAHAAEDTAAAADLPLLNGPAPGETRKGDMIYRPLGRTGESVSLVGIGGSHISKPDDEAEAIRIVRTAVDRGVTFMDNCWDYSDGKSEERMGKALRDGYRDKVFLMTKIDGRTRASAAQQIDECLRRLQTDHVDLLQHHEILRMEDPDAVFAKDGSMAAVLEAQKAGKVRFIGFTGHKDPAVHLRMLEVAAQNDFHFDTAQMPLNIMDAQFRSFSRQVVPALVKAGVGVLGMKSLGSGVLLKSKTVSPVDCLHYAMSLPVSTVIAGIDSMPILEQALEAVRTYKPLDAAAVAALMNQSRVAAARGEFELYKISNHFDGTAKNPQWLGYDQKA